MLCLVCLSLIKPNYLSAIIIILLLSGAPIQSFCYPYPLLPIISTSSSSASYTSLRFISDSIAIVNLPLCIIQKHLLKLPDSRVANVSAPRHSSKRHSNENLRIQYPIPSDTLHFSKMEWRTAKYVWPFFIGLDVTRFNTTLTRADSHFHSRPIRPVPQSAII